MKLIVYGMEDCTLCEAVVLEAMELGTWGIPKFEDITVLSKRKDRDDIISALVDAGWDMSSVPVIIEESDDGECTAYTARTWHEKLSEEGD